VPLGRVARDRQQCLRILSAVPPSNLSEKPTEDLVIGDRRLIHPRILLELSRAEGHPSALDDDLAIVAFAHEHLPPGSPSRNVVRLEQVHAALVVERQVLRDAPLFLPGTVSRVLRPSCSRSHARCRAALRDPPHERVSLQFAGTDGDRTQELRP
jgi:hypothetical protein